MENRKRDVWQHNGNCSCPICLPAEAAAMKYGMANMASNVSDVMAIGGLTDKTSSGGLVSGLHCSEDGTIHMFQYGDICQCGKRNRNQPVTPPTATGWICPVCGAGNAPWNPTCPCKSAK